MFPNVIANRARCALTAALAVIVMLATTSNAQAQFAGENLLGDMGVKSGSQPEPGLYVSAIYYRYFTDRINDADGDRMQIDPTGQGSQTIQAGMPLVYYVAKKKVLGAHFGALAVLPIATGSLEAPGFGLSETAGSGLSDLYVMPAQLGWHFARADLTAGVGLFVPTGRYTAGADDNLGRGMWSYEISGGGTMFVDRARSLSLSTMAYWETHSKKDGEVRVGNFTVSDVKVGQILTLEGGIGRSFLHGAATVGMAYYAQWKLTSDDLGAPIVPGAATGLPKHRVFGLGPEVTIPIATKTRLLSLVNVRYLWEHGAQVKTQGRTLIVTSTIPFGHTKIQAKGTSVNNGEAGDLTTW